MSNYQPTILDGYCGQGGAGMGYARAGFRVIGVDIKPQPRYPFEFIQSDFFDLPIEYLRSFSAIHTSPPCQGDSWCTPKDCRERHQVLIDQTREKLIESGQPFVIENVGGARRRLINPVKLCGSMVGLQSYRHRYFEMHPRELILLPPCNHNFSPLLVTTAGSNSRAIREPGAYKSVMNAPRAYGIDWMNADGLKEAIPPAYTEFIGRQLMNVISQTRESAA